LGCNVLVALPAFERPATSKTPRDLRRPKEDISTSIHIDEFDQRAIPSSAPEKHAGHSECQEEALRNYNLMA
jgi:hypothetical protein